MQEKIVYEYAVIRLVPKVERGEFINVGIILFSKSAKFIRFEYFLNEEKIGAISNEVDLEVIHTTLKTYQKIAYGEREGGDIAGMEIPERFRWLTAVRSACIQTSRPHTGITNSLNHTFEKLFDELVK